MSRHKNKIKVWDIFVRTFHWGIVVSFITAYVTSQSGMQITHSYIGYLICTLLLARLVWGFVGSAYARFSNFPFSLSAALAYARQILKGTLAVYLGHNPTGSIMIYTFLVILLTLCISGFILLGGLEFEGPALDLVGNFSDEVIYQISDLHQFCVDLMWFLVTLHVLGVITASLQHKDNLVKAMFTGYKKV